MHAPTTPTITPPPRLAAALEYAARGLNVFPVPLGTKKSHKSAEFSGGAKWGQTKNQNHIRRDFRRNPDANIGCPTGKENGFFVLEADTEKGHGVDGIAELEKLKAQRGLPDTLMAISPTGSLHYHFNHPGGDIEIKNSDSEIAPGVDVRGDGGMVLVPPSVKPGVGEYKWLNDLPKADAPAWLIELARKKTHEPKKANSASVPPSEDGADDDNRYEADPDLIAAAFAVMTNDERVNFGEWNKIAMAAHRATRGSIIAFTAFDRWSQKHSKYDARDTIAKWHVLFQSPPSDVGAGTIFQKANEASPSWRDDYDREHGGAALLRELLTKKSDGVELSAEAARAIDHRPVVGNAAEGITTSSAAAQELAEACTAMAAAKENQRNDVLQKLAFNMGQLIGIGRMSEPQALADLTEAAISAGMSEPDIAASIASGFAAGKLKPRMPTIKMIPGQIAQAIDHTEAELIASRFPIFQRAGVLVQPIKHELAAADDTKTEVVLLRALRKETLIYVTNKYAGIFKRYDSRKRQYVDIDPPSDVAIGLLQKDQWKFPEIAGVITAPTMRPDGTILDKPGFDPATQLYYHPDRHLVIPPISEKPTRDEALAALHLIEGLLDGFPFVAELDRAVALAGLMSPVLRGAFNVGPMTLLAAHVMGSGKSHYVNVASTIATGRACPVITSVASQEENEKRLGALILEGAPIISLDNCSHDLGGDLLCQITEQRYVRIRILGKSETPTCEWRGTLFATGNNITFREDMTRRGLSSNLDAAIERPETREFKFDPVKVAAERRGKFIHAILTISRAYQVSDAPKACGPIASYEAWSKAVREPLVWLGKPDPVLSMDTLREEDPARIAARTLIELWQNCLPASSYSVAELIKVADEMVTVAGFTPIYEYALPELHELLVQQAGGIKAQQIDSRKVARWLAAIRGQVHDGARLIVVRTSKGHGHRYAVERLIRPPSPPSGDAPAAVAMGSDASDRVQFP